LELLGKISDVGLFAEKTEITVTHTADSLEHAIKDKIARILGIKESQVHDGEFNELEELQHGDDNGDDEGQPPKKSGREWLQQTKEDTDPPEEVPHSSS